MFRVCLVACAAALSGATDAVSLLQVTAEKRQEPKCKDLKKAFKDAKASLKAARQQAKAALAARKTAKDAFLVARQSMESGCPAPEVDPGAIPSCNRGAGPMVKGHIAAAEGMRANDFYLNNGWQLRDTGLGSCAGMVYNNPMCANALVAYVLTWPGRYTRCYCAGKEHNVARKFWTKESPELNDNMKAALDNPAYQTYACWIDDKVQNDFSLNPIYPHVFTNECKDNPHFWIKYAQEDEKKRVMVGNARIAGKMGCVGMVQAHPKCKRWATRVSYRGNGDCYCEWGGLTGATSGTITTNTPEWIRAAWGSETCAIPKSPVR